MQRPPQYPIQSPQSAPNQRSVSPPLPGSPQAYTVNFQDGVNSALINQGIHNSQNFQQFHVNQQQNYFRAQPLAQGNIQNIHYVQDQSISHINAPAYNSKPNSPVNEFGNNQNRIYHSQSVHVSSPTSINGNNGFFDAKNHQRRRNVYFNYIGRAPLPTVSVKPLPEPVHQVIPAPPREIQLPPPQQVAIQQQGFIQQTVVRTEIVWQRRFVEIYTKFQIFVQKFQVMIEEVYIIQEQFDSVSDEDGWNELRGRYAELMNKFNEVRQDIITVLEDNKKAIESLNPQILEEMQGAEDNGSNQNEEEEKGQNSTDNVWEHRYYELMQQHDVLSQQYGQIREQYENLASRKEGQISLRPTDQRNKVAELENNLNTLHSEYQELGENYNKLEQAYSQVVAQLQQQNDEWNQEQAQRMIQALEEQTHNSHQKIQYLEEQLRIASQNKSNNPNDQHFNVYESRIEELLEEKNILIKNMNQMKSELEQYDEELNRRQNIIESQSTRIYELEEHIENSKKMDAMGQDSLKEELHNAIETIRENERNIEQYRKVVEERERVLEDIARNRDDIARENEEFFNRIQENERQMIERQQLIERLERRIKLLSEEQEDKMKEDKVDPGLFSERVKIEVDSAVNDKNRKIRSLTQELEDINAQIEKVNQDKEKSIQKIKEYFSEEEDRKNKLIHEKDNNIRILSDKVRSLEHELSNRNMEISRFRHQSNTTSLGGEDSRKLSQNMEKKNSEIQKIRRGYEQKCLEIKELEQKLGSVQHQLSTKVFEINTLKRQSYEFHGVKAEIESQNTVIKKKNQEINELRLKVIENEQMENSITSLEREKTRLNELLKEKSRQIENKDSTICNLEKKISNLRMDIGPPVSSSSKQIEGFNTFDNSLVKKKQAEIRKLKNEIEMKEATISTLEKTIKEKETKVSTQQKTNNLLKAEIENKINRYENEIKDLQKQMKESRNTKEDNEMAFDSMKAKIVSLQNSLEQRNVMYDHEIALSKQKIQSVEQANTTLMIEKEMAKTVIQRSQKQNKQLHEKIKNLQQKLESKTKLINDLKATFSKKEKDEAKGYQDKIKQLDGEIKLDSVKMKKMEDLIQQLSSKLKDVETEKRSYRERLLTETSGDRDLEFRFMTEYNNETMPNIEIFEMDKFKIKDAESNNVFERKVIYELKKENDILRKELSGMGYSSVSLNNRYETQNQLSIYQQEFNTEQNRPEEDHQAEILLYHKNINKELQERIDELLKVNKNLKQKIASLSSNTNNPTSIQFYKEQVVQLESEVAQLKKRIKELMNDNKNGKSESQSYGNELRAMTQKNSSLESKINELKGLIMNLQAEKAQLENSKAIQASEIIRLNEMLKKEKAEVGDNKQREKAVSEYKQKCSVLEQQIVKLTNRVQIMKSQTERLNEVVKTKLMEMDDLRQGYEEQIWELKKIISEREAEIQSLRMNSQQEDPQLRYKLELLRSLYQEVDSLVGQICIRSEPEQQIVEAIRINVNQGLNVIPTLARG